MPQAGDQERLDAPLLQDCVQLARGHAGARVTDDPAEGRSNAGIVAALVLTVGAVEKHIASIFTKLQLPQTGSDHRRVLAVLAYLQQD
jgi:hypothetical protein